MIVFGFISSISTHILVNLLITYIMETNIKIAQILK